MALADAPRACDGCLNRRQSRYPGIHSADTASVVYMDEPIFQQETQSTTTTAGELGRVPDGFD